jgi:hypothetical protein
MTYIGNYRRNPHLSASYFFFTDVTTPAATSSRQPLAALNALAFQKNNAPESSLYITVH